ncbi:fructosamine kinase family protein [Catellatospora vulcania]|uniref:fructosamine kinase family protein n=1 Tax=Catellatospora vulcania TaxID=1460450 RepID=UPI0012D48249|nr:fructosamine kinase family protein [Catellatospora vulcania]
MRQHPLCEQSVVTAVERAASAHRGRRWTVTGFTDLDDRASHPAGILHGTPFSVFVKLDRGPRGAEQFTAELRGHRLLRERAGAATPVPVGDGPVSGAFGSLLLLEALPEVPARARTAAQWRSIGRALATVHQARGERHGLAEFDGFFGPLPQDNRPAGTTWADFYVERRLLPRLRDAVDSGHLPAELAAGVTRLAARLPQVCGPEPEPSLLHGDAQQNNFLTTADEAVLLDTSPCYGHPESDLALLDYFTPVPGEVFDGYREVAPIDPGFAQRRELWRLHGYLAVVAVDGTSEFGRPYVGRIAAATAGYR